jgi:hypothetical protein
MDNLASHKVSCIGRYFAALYFGRYWHLFPFDLCETAEALQKPTEGNGENDPGQTFGSEGSLGVALPHEQGAGLTVVLNALPLNFDGRTALLGPRREFPW